MTKLFILSEDMLPKEYYGPSNVASDVNKVLSNYYSDITIKSIPIKGAKNRTKYIMNYITDTPKIIKIGLELLFESKSYDIIVFQYLRGLSYIAFSLLSKTSKRPSFMYIYFPLQKYHGHFLRNITYFIVLNPYMISKVADIGIPKKKIVMIPPPISIDKFKPLNKYDLLQKYDVPPNRFIIVYHGRPSRARGLLLLLESVISMSKKWDDLFVVLSLANTNDDLSLNDIINFININELNNVVKVIAGVNNSVEIYNLADVVVFPFIVNSPICPPLSVLECMATGSIVVVSDLEGLGIKYILKNGYNGYLIDPNKDSLISCIEHIKKLNLNDFNTVGRNARHTITSEYSFSIVGEKLSKLLGEF